MKKLIINTTLLLVSVFLIGQILIYLCTKLPSNRHDFMRASILKERLLDSVPSPRVLFVGGSNLSFGIDSKYISDSLGLPVVNMGFHAGLGLTFALNETQSGVKKGDIIVLCTEYFLGDKKSKDLPQLAVYNPSAARFLPKGEDNAIFETIRLEVAKMQITFTSTVYNFLTGENGLYHDDKFNAYGDMVGHLDKPSEAHLAGAFKFPKTDYSPQIAQLNAFAAAATQKGARVVFMYPTYAQTGYDLNKEEIEATSAQMSQKLQVPILNTPASQVYPDSLFFDTIYHLTREGRARRAAYTVATLRAQGLGKK